MVKIYLSLWLFLQMYILLKYCLGIYTNYRHNIFIMLTQQRWRNGRSCNCLNDILIRHLHPHNKTTTDKKTKIIYNLFSYSQQIEFINTKFVRESLHLFYILY